MLTAIGDVMRKCYDKGWITTRDGNISVRRSLDGHISPVMYITPSGTVKRHIHPADLVKVEMDNFSEERYPNASIELAMHFLLQFNATSTQSVVHVHPTHVVAAMHAGIDLRYGLDFPEIFRYTKVGPTVQFHNPGTDGLAIETNEAFHDNGTEKLSTNILFDIVGQKSHGVCAVAKDPWSAYEHIERLDHICQIALLAKSHS